MSMPSMSLVQLSMRALSKGAVSELYTAQILDVGWSKSLDFVANKQNERSAKDVNALQIHLLHPAAPDDLDHQCFRNYRVLIVVDHLLTCCGGPGRQLTIISERYQDLKLPFS